MLERLRPDTSSYAEYHMALSMPFRRKIIIKPAHISGAATVNNCDCLLVGMLQLQVAATVFSHDRLSQLVVWRLVFCEILWEMPQSPPIHLNPGNLCYDFNSLLSQNFWQAAATLAILKVPLTRDWNNWINLIKRSATKYLFGLLLLSSDLVWAWPWSCGQIVKCWALNA